MIETRTVHLNMTVELQVPASTVVDALHLGIADAKILNNFSQIEGARISTWWTEKVIPCVTRFVNCPVCKKIEMIGSDVVTLDGSPLCLHCSANFVHGEIKQPNEKGQARP